MTMVTAAQLDNAVEWLNNNFQLPVDSWKDGKAQIGNIHIDGAYGGWKLVQHQTDGGGVREISPRGSRREVLEYINAMIKGAAMERERNKSMQE